jgi:hypothetical protein
LLVMVVVVMHVMLLVLVQVLVLAIPPNTFMSLPRPVRSSAGACIQLIRLAG